MILFATLNSYKRAPYIFRQEFWPKCQNQHQQSNSYQLLNLEIYYICSYYICTISGFISVLIAVYQSWPYPQIIVFTPSHHLTMFNTHYSPSIHEGQVYHVKYHCFKHYFNPINTLNFRGYLCYKTIFQHSLALNV